MPIVIRSALATVLLLVANAQACVPHTEQSKQSTSPQAVPTTPLTEPEINIEPCKVPDGFIAEVVLGAHCFFEVDGEAYDFQLVQDWIGDEEPLQYIVKVRQTFVYVDPGDPFTIGYWTGELIEEPQTVFFEGKQVATTPRVMVRLK